MPSVRVAACQINTFIGDLQGNVDRIIDSLSRATEAGADIAVFPELAITGYPPEDLLLKPGFINDNLAALRQVASATTDCVAILGFVDVGIDLYNAAAVCRQGEVVGKYHKRGLPNYAVFDEQRYFAPGDPATTLYGIAGVKVGVSVCEDAWSPSGPIAQQAAGGAELMVNLNASPYYAGKMAIRQRVMATRAADASIPLVYVNQVGGQDELVFDGGSMIFDSNGGILASAAQFIEEVMIVDIDVRPGFRKRLLNPRSRPGSPPLPVLPVKEGTSPERQDTPVAAIIATPLAGVAEVYNALVLGTADYVRKNGFSDVVLGLSGGLDSSLVTAIAVDALGSEHVHAVAMPSRYSSDDSLSDARALADNLHIDLRVVPIEEGHTALRSILAEPLGEDIQGITDENLQSRLRGMILMALSNELGWLVLTTGNKSELAVGYSTLYGDTAGGFAVIKDVTKTTAYALCRWRNQQTSVIPERVLEKPPTAELRPDQRDDQSLPPYEVLDPIVEAYVENDMTRAEIQALGFEPEVVNRIIRMIDHSEYKRRQSPIGVRVTPKAFGKDRRVPITNGYPS